MTFLQKAVMPARERAWLAAGDDLLCGYVVAAADVTWATTAAQLAEVHGLSFPGSPYAADPEFVDVIRFPASTASPVIPALGTVAGTKAGPFADHPPFDPRGFACTEHNTVPVWWLDPIRVPPGSEIWRVFRDGSEELVASYAHVASGWIAAAGYAVEKITDIQPSHLLGVFGVWNGERVLADILPTGKIVVASLTELPGMHLVARGFWATVAEPSAVEELGLLRLVGRWRELPCQVVRSFENDQFRVVYVGRDAFAAEAAGMQKTDAGVYEATILQSELADLSGVSTSVAAPTDEAVQPPGDVTQDREQMITRGRQVFARFTDASTFTVVDLPDELGVALVHAVRGGGTFFIAPDLSVLYSASSQPFEEGLDAFRSGRRTPAEKLRGA